MWDFVKGLFVWAIKKILYIIFPAIGWIVFFFENFSDVIKSIWNYFTTWVSWYFQDGYIWFFNWLSGFLGTLFSEHEFVVSVAEFSNDFFTQLNVFLPMNETCACLSLILATQVAVFCLRIILKAIPTVW
jgi:hypothetical protein